jgi:hypothetical protein
MTKRQHGAVCNGHAAHGSGRVSAFSQQQRKKHRTMSTQAANIQTRLSARCGQPRHAHPSPVLGRYAHNGRYMHKGAQTRQTQYAHAHGVTNRQMHSEIDKGAGCWQKQRYIVRNLHQKRNPTDAAHFHARGHTFHRAASVCAGAVGKPDGRGVGMKECMTNHTTRLSYRLQGPTPATGILHPSPQRHKQSRCRCPPCGHTLWRRAGSGCPPVQALSPSLAPCLTHKHTQSVHSQPAPDSSKGTPNAPHPPPPRAPIPLTPCTSPFGTSSIDPPGGGPVAPR